MGCIQLSSKRVGGISLDSKRHGEMSVRSRRHGGICVSSSLVCLVSHDKYIRVAPNIIWLTPANLNSDDVNVRSNTDWNVV